MKNQVEKEVESHESDKRVTELLSSSLNDLTSKYSGKLVDVEQTLLSIDETFEKYKESYEDSLRVVDPLVEPLGSTVITTASILNMIEAGNFLMSAKFDIELIKGFQSTVSDKQIVLAAGPNCRQVKPGDVVSIRLQDFVRRINPNTVNSKEVSEIPIEVINERNYLSINEGNIRHIIKDEGYHKRREQTNKNI